MPCVSCVVVEVLKMVSGTVNSDDYLRLNLLMNCTGLVLMMDQQTSSFFVSSDFVAASSRSEMSLIPAY